MFTTPTGKRLYAPPRRRTRRDPMLRDPWWHKLFFDLPRPLLLVELDTLAIVDANRAAASRYGWSAEELCRFRLSDLYLAEEHSRLTAAVASGFMGPEAGGRWRQRDRDGDILHVVTNAYPVSVGKRRFCLIDIEDESGLLRAEEALLMMQALMDQAQEATDLGLWVAGLDDYALMTWTHNVYRIYGLDSADFHPTLGAALALVHPDDLDRVTGAIDQAMADSGQFSLDHRIIRPSGEVRWVHLRARVIVTDDATPARMLGLVLDITDRKQHEADLIEQERLRMALTQESAMRQLQERFVSFLSHEFKTPLASITLAIDVLNRYGANMSEAERRERTERIQTLARDLNHLVEDVLVLVRAESSGRLMQFENIAIVRLLRDVISHLEQGGASPGQGRIMLEGADDLSVSVTVVRGDARLLTHALSNLISNALKYSPSETPVEIALQCADGVLTVTIRDHGIGMAERDLPHVFEPFYRGSNVGELPGTGLGLTIAHQVIHLHDGSIAVQSAPGQGTTFTVTLPIT